MNYLVKVRIVHLLLHLNGVGVLLLHLLYLQRQPLLYMVLVHLEVLFQVRFDPLNATLREVKVRVYRWHLII